jgi:predicted O-methyltransferase YrrM
MTLDLWTNVDRYFNSLLLNRDPILEKALEASAVGNLPPANVAPNQGKLLWMLAKMCNARSILEIGTLGGYSTIWLARALPPGGELVTLESQAHHAAVARANIELAGLGHLVDIRIGTATESLARLRDEQRRAFDLVFIDADKQSNPEYVRWALELTSVGSVIAADNVVRNGSVIQSELDDPSVRGIRRFAEIVGSERRLAATAIQTVGEKGYDGFVIALVVA